MTVEPHASEVPKEEKVMIVKLDACYTWRR